jgi:hypothetical protein
VVGAVIRRLPDMTSVRWKLVAFITPELVGATLAILFALVVLVALLPYATASAVTGSPSPSV